MMEKNKAKEWLALAAAKDDNYRLLAIELISSVAEYVQEELIMWYAYNATASFRASIFEHLDDNSKAKIAQLKLGGIDSSDFVQVYPERLIFGKKIREHILERKETNRISLMKEYLREGDCNLKDAIIAIHSLESNLGYVF